MVKEKLTIDNMKQDLKESIKTKYIFAVLFFLLFCGLCWLCTAILKVGGLFVFYGIVFGLSTVAAAVTSVSMILDIIKYTKMLKAELVIVKDKLVGCEVKDHYRKARKRWRHYKTYHLYFSGYGEYEIGGVQVNGTHYKWSKLYCLSHESVYNRSDCGDEFYLVLTKPHTGKIALVYNTKMFELVE